MRSPFVAVTLARAASQILDRVGGKRAVLIQLRVRDEPMRFNALQRTIEAIRRRCSPKF